MSKELLRRKIAITPQSNIAYNPNFSEQGLINQVGQTINATGQYLQKQAEAMYINEFQTAASKASREIYEKNKDNPVQLEKELNDYKKSILSNTPNYLAPQFSEEFDRLSFRRVNLAKDAYLKQQRLSSRLSMENRANEIQNNIVDAVDDVYSNNEGLSPEQIATKQILAGDVINGSMQSYNEMLYQTDDAGNPIYTPEQAIKKQNSLIQVMASSAAKKFIENSPDKVAMYSKWMNNEVVLKIGDQDVNIRENLSPELRKKVDNDVVSDIKDYFSIRNSQNKLQETEFKNFQQAYTKDLFSMAYDGQLSLNNVKASKNILETDSYKLLYKMAKEDNPITNGDIKIRLIQDVVNGEDITNKVFTYRKQNLLSNEDTTYLLNYNENKSIYNSDPVKAGRNYLNTSLSKELNSYLSAMPRSGQKAMSGALQKALADSVVAFDQMVADKTKDFGRPLLRQEVYQIAKDVYNEYSVFDYDTRVDLALPKFLDKSYKINIKNEITPQVLDEVKKKTIASFKQKYQGNISAMKKDIDFRREYQKIKAWESYISTKQENINTINRLTNESQ